MILRKRLFLIVFISTLLSACASPSGPPFELQPAVSDKVTIYAFRIASIVGGGNSYLTAVNNRFIGRINSGTYAVYVTEPGEKMVSMKAGSIFFGEGEELGFLLRGHIRLNLDGKTFTLYEGDCFYFMADKKHSIVNTGRTKAIILWVVTPPIF